MKLSNPLFRIAVVSLVAFSVILETGCGWVSEAQAIVKVVTPSVINVLELSALLKGKTLNDADVKAIQNWGDEADSDLKLVGDLIDAYQSAPDDQKAGVLAKIETAIKTGQSNTSGLLAALHISDAASQNKFTSIATVVLNEFGEIEALLPLVHPASGVRASAMATVRAAAAVTTKTKRVDAKHFKAAFNSAMTTPTGNAVVDAATKKLALK